MGFDIIWDLTHIIGVGHWSTGPQWWRAELRETKTMENLNFDNDAVIDPRDAEIAKLRKQLEDANRRVDFQSHQLDQFGDAIMGVIGDKVEAVIESRVGDLVEDAFNDFDISNFECEIGDMIDERLPVGLDDESRREDAKALIGEILAGATITMSIE